MESHEIIAVITNHSSGNIAIHQIVDGASQSKMVDQRQHNVTTPKDLTLYVHQCPLPGSRMKMSQLQCHCKLI